MLTRGGKRKARSPYVCEALLAEEEHRLVGLDTEDLGLDELNRRAVDLDETVAALAVSDSRGVLLAAKDLDGFDRGSHGSFVRNEQ
jgi:hypothetical protein